MKKPIPPTLVLTLTLACLALQALPMLQSMQIATVSICWPFAALFSCCGLALSLAGKVQFSRNDSEIHPFRTPRNLVTDGVFRFTRNPMYLGFILFLVGVALLVNLWPAMLAPFLFFFAINSWYVPHEERAAAAMFGDDYLAYTQQVRRWI